MRAEFPNFLFSRPSGIECSIQRDRMFYAVRLCLLMVENSGTHNKSYFASTGAVMIVPLSLAYQM